MEPNEVDEGILDSMMRGKPHMAFIHRSLVRTAVRVCAFFGVFMGALYGIPIALGQTGSDSIWGVLACWAVLSSLFVWTTLSDQERFVTSHKYGRMTIARVASGGVGERLLFGLPVSMPRLGSKPLKFYRRALPEQRRELRKGDRIWILYVPPSIRLLKDSRDVRVLWYVRACLPMYPAEDGSLESVRVDHLTEHAPQRTQRSQRKHRSCAE
jgi:hypothetical protein